MVMFLNRPCQLGHSPAVAARFYVKSRSEVADKAAMENTVHIDVNTVEKPGSKMGPVDAKTGSKMGPVGIRQDTEKNPHEMQKPNDKHGVLRGSEGVSNTHDETDQWAVLDSKKALDSLGNIVIPSELATKLAHFDIESRWKTLSTTNRIQLLALVDKLIKASNQISKRNFRKRNDHL